MNKTKVFISYSHQDEYYRQELENHLSVLKRNGDIDTWTDRKIIAGENWEGKISAELLNAKIILLLISPDFLASNYCYDIEMKTAIDRHINKDAIVVPIILRHCDWSNTPFSSIQGLPINAVPVKEWNDQDKAFFNVVDGIKVILKSLKESDFVPEIKGKKELSHLRKKVISAKTFRELKEAEFELEEYKKLFPLTFDVLELENLIKRSIRYEKEHYENMRSEREYAGRKYMEYSQSPAKRGCLKTSFLIAIFATIIATLVYFFLR